MSTFAELGDVVNIILEEHGAKSGEYCIGDHHLHTYDMSFETALRNLDLGFRQGCRVDAMARLQSTESGDADGEDFMAEK